MSVKSRVIAGFIALNCLLIAIAVNYDFGLRDIHRGVGVIDQSAASSGAVGEFSRSALEARRAVEHYLRSSGGAELIEVRTADAAVEKQIDILANLLGERSNALHNDVGHYRQAFEQIVKIVKQRDSAASALRATGARLTNIAVTIATEGAAAGSIASPDAIRMDQAIQALQADALHYSLRPNSSDYDLVVLEQGRAGREFADLQHGLDSLPAELRGVADQIPAQLDKLGQALDGLTTASRGFQDATTALTRLGTQLDGDCDKLMAEYLDARERSLAGVEQTVSSVTIAGIAISSLAIIAGLGLAAVVGYSIGALMSRTTHVMTTISSGRLDLEVPNTDRKDEIGAMARAVEVFRDNSLALKAAQTEAAQNRATAEAERARVEAERAAAAKELAAVVDSIGRGLDQLSAGTLTFRLNQSFAQDYEKLRVDFNDAMEKLADAMTAVATNTAAIRSGSTEISSAAIDLSRRTEQQAASLEETAAALDEITATVKKTSQGASRAREVVSDAKINAERSGEVVYKAVQAMTAIEQSSRQISQIIGVVDEIAFQTNLLALNAGVEAARAGDAGRGFAVVASEVRGLAQRSAEAAKEIKALISTSSDQVADGVTLVSETGKALEKIVAQVGEINSIVNDIAISAQEQATGLDQVNTAINQMDQVTQQNAAMVEESTAASQSLHQETEQLTQLISRFQTGTVELARTARLASSRRAAGSLVSRPVPSLKKMGGRGGVALTADIAGWQEF